MSTPARGGDAPASPAAGGGSPLPAPVDDDRLAPLRNGPHKKALLEVIDFCISRVT